MKKITLPMGTEIRPSEVGYYDFWYPSPLGIILLEEVEAVPAAGRFSRVTGMTPYVVKPAVASKYGSPINVIWVKT